MRGFSLRPPLDLFLICEKCFLPLGRPTLTMLIDRYSRMPFGYYLSFGAPSAAAVMGALRHAILPKTKLKQTIPGLEIEHEWWMCLLRARPMLLARTLVNELTSIVHNPKALILVSNAV